MSRKAYILIASLAAIVAPRGIASAQDVTSFPLDDDGTIPAWIVAGPFDLGTVGFGEPRDFDAIGEATIRPKEGDRRSHPFSSEAMQLGMLPRFPTRAISI